MYILKLYVNFQQFDTFLPSCYSYNLEIFERYSDADTKREVYQNDINWFTSAMDSGIFGYPEWETKEYLNHLIHRYYGYDYNQYMVDAMTFVLYQKESFKFLSFNLSIKEVVEES